MADNLLHSWMEAGIALATTAVSTVAGWGASKVIQHDKQIAVLNTQKDALEARLSRIETGVETSRQEIREDLRDVKQLLEMAHSHSHEGPRFAPGR